MLKPSESSALLVRAYKPQTVNENEVFSDSGNGLDEFFMCPGVGLGVSSRI